MDYKQTVFLPKTEFPMRGGLPKKEPEILERWQKLGLYDQLRKARKNAPKFVLHDGPPYANGQLHIGHALNKILKDVINRSQSMLARMRIMCLDGIVMVCQLNGRLKSNIGKKEKIRMRCLLPNSGRNAVILPLIG